MDKVEQVKKIVLQEFKRLKKKKVSAKELKQAKNFIEGKMLMKSEDTLESCKNNLYLDFTGEKDTKSFLKKINQVTPEDVLKTAKKYFKNNYALVLIQPKKAISANS
jgi:predicted Zn-dependent peptidase